MQRLIRPKKRSDMEQRGDALRDALSPLAEKGVTPEQAMALIMASGAVLRQGVGLGWPEIEAICDAVFAADEGSQ